MEVKMKILTKKLGRAEVMCRCIIIPRDKKALFPVPGVKFDIHEGKETYEAKIDKQYRLRSISWFRRHRTIKAGDEVTFFKEDGAIRISLSRAFSIFRPLLTKTVRIGTNIYTRPRRFFDLLGQ